MCSLAEKDNNTDVWKYSQLLFFSFYYIKCTDELINRGLKTADPYTQELRDESSVKSLLLYIKTFLYIPDVRTNSRGHTSSLLLTRCTWACLLLVFHPHKFSWLHLQPVAYTMLVITLPSSVSPTQFTQNFRHEPLRPVYFRYYVYFLLFFFRLSDSCSYIERRQRGLQVNIQHGTLTGTLIPSQSCPGINGHEVVL